MTTEQFQNQVAPTAVLVQAIGATDTSCIVSNPANFSVLAAGQQFQMAIQDNINSAIEVVTVTATSGANFTITRAAGALAHVAGAAAAQVVTGAQFSAMYPNGAQLTGASPYTFDGSQPIMEVKPVTPQAITVNIVTAKLVPFRVYTISDGAFNAGTNHITLTPDSGNIGGVGQSSPASTFVISTNGGAARFYWNGTNCRLV